MKSIEYVQKEEQNVESLLEMLDQSIRRVGNGKDVPPYMLKEIIELLQTYISGPHGTREDTILALLGRYGMDVPVREYDEVYRKLKKYDRFLLRVVEAYDLGYHGARGVFAHYASQYICVLRQYFGLVNELLATWISMRDNRDNEILKRLQEIDGRAKKIRERRLIRMEMLQRDLRNVAA